ncbi:carbohydrate kinase, YjeF related protein [Catenulispora acidiphila DSM 44928]|uniref:Bifunctional NAD(P)H-hydrate repair enzyme n=1 Tax=Catenulispora acidiphila (strain DSM 44928 / JCM 14897 / NBRC 102108 / NRRL B-24433 / ID139908) TaxID=479433 RepID=C7Q456_CATAD|nr:bifunctional ADP-dependent NAD(P)H-hydrate dehydratase/NAD(P)H-hydrate epimerase [Catenulispora acidiphila]ACU69916.1 carbohydrate kinase, YjeF related protein [Catenulispora acidiphila DSM 44928]
MLTAHSVDQVRHAEAALMARLPDGELMQRAVAGLTAQCVGLLGRVYGARVLVVAGSGDNGGDALYAAARLARRGAKVEAVLLDEARAHAGGLAALRAAGGRVSAAGEWRFSGADLVLDGVVGIGGRGGLRPAAAAVFEQIESVKKTRQSTHDKAPRTPLIVAVDLPSGIDADTGEVAGPAVHADVTVTFGTYKPGLLISPGAEHVGDLRFVDIGLAPHLEGAPVLEALEPADVEALLPTPSAESNKYRRGVVGIAAGSPRYPGAAVLATGAALRSGVGAVRFVGESEVSDGVLAHYPEVMVGEGRVQAWVVGPGIGPDSADRVEKALTAEVPVLVDADGLAALAHRDKPLDRPHPTLLTPHSGEAARLLGDPWSVEHIEAQRLAAVRELANRFGCTVLLKGSTTLIAAPETTTVRVNRTGTPTLATAGSGDVLSGLTGGLLATGLPPLDAASLAAHLHGEAARDVHRRHPGRQLIAGDLIEAVRASR